MSALKTIVGTRGYPALALVFMTNSLLEASWIIYIPSIMEKFSIGAGLMGSAIFFKAVGAFLGMPFTPPLINRIGEGKFTFITSLLFCCSIPLIVVAPSYTISSFTDPIRSAKQPIAMNSPPLINAWLNMCTIPPANPPTLTNPIPKSM